MEHKKKMARQSIMQEGRSQVAVRAIESAMLKEYEDMKKKLGVTLEFDDQVSEREAEEAFR
jgi:hypothetical protein